MGDRLVLAIAIFLGIVMAGVAYSVSQPEAEDTGVRACRSVAENPNVPPSLRRNVRLAFEDSDDMDLAREGVRYVDLVTHYNEAEEPKVRNNVFKFLQSSHERLDSLCARVSNTK